MAYQSQTSTGLSVCGLLLTLAGTVLLAKQKTKNRIPLTLDNNTPQSFQIVTFLRVRVIGQKCNQFLIKLLRVLLETSPGCRETAREATIRKLWRRPSEHCSIKFSKRGMFSMPHEPKIVFQFPLVKMLDASPVYL